MSNETPRLKLPYLAAAQAQKHVTHNEALDGLDALVQLSVSGIAAAPEAAPVDGAQWLVGAAASGAFAGQEGALASFRDGAWTFRMPMIGWRLYDQAARRLMVFDGSTWQPVGASEQMARLGIGTPPDNGNRLAVAAPSALFTHAGSDHRLIVNKAAPGAAAALLFQDAYAGRAEIGLLGDDRLAVKVSADGQSWRLAIAVDPASGRASFPSGVIDPLRRLGSGPVAALGASGDIHLTLAGLTQCGTATLSPNRLYMAALVLPVARRCTSLAIRVVAPAVQGACRLGLYGDDGSCHPGRLVIDAGTVDTGSPGLKRLAIDVALDQTLYWFAALSNAGASVVAPAAQAAALLGINAQAAVASEAAVPCLFRAQSFGALTLDESAQSFTPGSPAVLPPVVYLR
jgi:Protein of unknown function (DUF2793)